MARPSEMLTLIVGDLSSLGGICPPGQALASAVPGPHAPNRMVFSWPALDEQPDPTRPGSQRTPIALICVFRFDYLLALAPGVRYAPGREPDAETFAAYDTGCRLRALFLGSCATRSAGYSVVVSGVTQNVASADSAQKTIGGSFSLTVRFDDASHIIAYDRSSGSQAGQDQG